jgi:pimeloyl-ACP methyl ester carboxylesterase
LKLDEAFHAWRRAGRYYRYRGHAIFHRIEGDGPTLVAIHGFPSASWDWWPIWPALTKRFRVVAPDLIGFGWSDKPPSYSYSVRDQASIVEGLLAEVGAARVHVLAHDYGDSVAEELLARYERRARSSETGVVLESICFLNGGLFPETHHALVAQKVLASRAGAFLGPLVPKRGFAAGLDRIFGPSTQPSAKLIDELWTLMLHNDGRRVAHPILGYIEERRRERERWVGALVETRVPKRLIVGGADPVSGVHMLRRYEALVPHPDTVLLPDVGHYPQVEAPLAVTQAFLQFHDRLANAQG